ncbi:MAG: CHD5-like protein-domain-containing protein [Piptocephalis tieghemiana]|nr:MAG: CHD5-like protein-domain-containing protein [Piptocephalis tieghemiana]
MWLALLILLLTLFHSVVRVVGYSRVAEKIYQLYFSLVSNPIVHERQKYKKETLRLRTQLRATNAHDEFAKWAKIRRKLDASTSKYDKLSSDLAFQRTGIQVKTALALRVGLYLSRGILLIGYGRSAVIVPPSGWMGPLGPLLSLPFAPSGSISVPVWMMVCHKVVGMGEQMLIESYQSIRDGKQNQREEGEEEEKEEGEEGVYSTTRQGRSLSTLSDAPQVTISQEPEENHTAHPSDTTTFSSTS